MISNIRRFVPQVFLYGSIENGDNVYLCGKRAYFSWKGKLACISKNSLWTICIHVLWKFQYRCHLFYRNVKLVYAWCLHVYCFVYHFFSETFTCSHYRAPDLFIESLKSKNCSFVSYECESWKEYQDKTCPREDNSTQIGLMGFYSKTAPGRGKQYLYTNKRPPYCRGNTTDPPEKWRRDYQK